MRIKNKEKLIGMLILFHKLKMQKKHFSLLKEKWINVNCIQRKLEDVNELRFFAKSWGIENADIIGEAQLRRILFNTVKKSEESKTETGKGYKEFMDEVLNTNPELTNARALVHMALTKSILAVGKTTRKVSYVPSGDTLCIVPLDNVSRINDYIADFLLRDKNKDLYNTIQQDINGPAPEYKLSIADVEGMKDRESLKKAAEKLGIRVLPQMKDETIRLKIIEKVE